MSASRDTSADSFAESVDRILETDKTKMHKVDSRVKKGIFLGYICCSTEYIARTADGIYKCRTMKRKADEIAYNAKFMDLVATTFNDYVLKGARTSAIATRTAGGGLRPRDQVIPRNRDFVPRRIYTLQADFIKHGYTQGCRGCAWVETPIGPRVPQSEQCRLRIEEAIAGARDRIDHYVAQQTEEGDVRGTCPRQEDAPKVEVAPEPAAEEAMDIEAERFNIEISSKIIVQNDGLKPDDLADGPDTFREHWIRPFVRPPCAKRGKQYT